jgi:hypothetical protein
VLSLARYWKYSTERRGMAAENDNRARAEREFERAQRANVGSPVYLQATSRARHYEQLAVMDRLERLLEKGANSSV